MTRNFTQADVLRYVYGETNEKEDKKIKDLILTNEQVADDFVFLSETKAMLNKVEYSASEKTIANILNYAKSQIVTSKNC
jgi:hypothetical protein